MEYIKIGYQVAFGACFGVIGALGLVVIVIKLASLFDKENNHRP